MDESLQKFTDADCDKLLQQPLSDEIMHSLSEENRMHLLAYMQDQLNTLKGEAFDRVWKNCEPIAAQVTKNQVWEKNHMGITYTIGKLMVDYGRMPTPTEIANESDLSRVTVTKHLKDYKNSPLYQQQINQFIFMRDKVLAKAYRFAVEGDMRAAKLFLDYTGGNGLQGDTINTQNNYIQVNQIKITQEEIQQLAPDQINQIEQIINSVVKEGPK